VLWLLLVGIAVAAAAVAFMRLPLGTFVRKLLEENADSPETAKSLSELGVRRNGYLSTSLKGRGPLSTVVRAVGEGPDAKYYIPESSVPLAKAKFRKEKIALPAILIGLVLLAAAAVGAAYLWPGLTGLWGSLFPS
ncbi:MAG: hypothetical protein ILO68_07380, partial [Clostridia bacterium]|nr:hypothetical protein [Clostridia bacterium]